MTKLLNLGDQVALQCQELQTLFTALQQADYELIAPTSGRRDRIRHNYLSGRVADWLNYLEYCQIWCTRELSRIFLI